jgi:hypothetical protein
MIKKLSWSVGKIFVSDLRFFIKPTNHFYIIGQFHIYKKQLSDVWDLLIFPGSCHTLRMHQWDLFYDFFRLDPK